MSRNEWENGQIKLPTSEFARIRKLLEEEAKARQTAAFDATQVFWKGLTRKQQTNKGEYQAAQHKRSADAHLALERTVYDYRGSRRVGATPDQQEAIYDVDVLLTRVSWGEGPRRVQKADVDWATNRTTAFSQSGLHVTLDKATSTLHWAVEENNHAVERARETWLAATVFKALEEVKWTRDTGGALYGGDEYAQDGARSNGYAYSDTMSRGFGPIGAAENPFATNDFLDSKGQKVRAREVFEKAEKANLAAMKRRSRVAKGVPTGGQFSAQSRGESSVGLGGSAAYGGYRW